MFQFIVLSVVLAAATANLSGLWGAGLATPLATPLATSWATPLATPWAAGVAPLAAPIAAIAPIGASNYRGPLSLAPSQPANILAADGRPLDTLSVNLDRAAHLTAKAIEGNGHLLKKRSIAAAPLLSAPLAAAPLAVAPLAAAPLLSAPLAAAPLDGAPWVGAGVVAGPWASPAVAVSQPAIPGARVITSAPLAIAAGAPIAPLGLRQLW